MRLARLAALLPVVILGAGCAKDAPCTKGAFESRVSVDFLSLGATAAAARLCVNQQCTDLSGASPATVALPGEGAYDVSITVSDAAGTALGSGSGRFTTVEQHPNGKGCPPTVYDLDLVLRDGALTVR